MWRDSWCLEWIICVTDFREFCKWSKASLTSGFVFSSEVGDSFVVCGKIIDAIDEGDLVVTDLVIITIVCIKKIINVMEAEYISFIFKSKK
jgi:hypothetical protein